MLAYDPTLDLLLVHVLDRSTTSLGVGEVAAGRSSSVCRSPVTWITGARYTTVQRVAAHDVDCIARRTASLEDRVALARLSQHPFARVLANRAASVDERELGLGPADGEEASLIAESSTVACAVLPLRRTSEAVRSGQRRIEVS